MQLANKKFKFLKRGMEKVETQTWLRVAFACKYITVKAYEKLMNLSEQVGDLLHHMITNPEKYR